MIDFVRAFKQERKEICMLKVYDDLNVRKNYTPIYQYANTPIHQYPAFYSLRSDLTGFASAALTLWNPTVKNATATATAPAAANTHHWMSMR